jgi:hypothetical protein
MVGSRFSWGTCSWCSDRVEARGRWKWPSGILENADKKQTNTRVTVTRRGLSTLKSNELWTKGSLKLKKSEEPAPSFCRQSGEQPLWTPWSRARWQGREHGERKNKTSFFPRRKQHGAVTDWRTKAAYYYYYYIVLKGERFIQTRRVLRRPAAPVRQARPGQARLWVHCDRRQHMTMWKSNAYSLWYRLVL